MFTMEQSFLQQVGFYWVESFATLLFDSESKVFLLLDLLPYKSNMSSLF